MPGWVKFKWRNHQPDIGRFFNVDPLAEKYVHNSVYAFSENKVTSHIELEGLEAFNIKVFSNPSNTSGRTGFGHKTPNNFKVDALGNVSGSNVSVSNYNSTTVEKEFTDTGVKGSRTTTTMTLTGEVGAGNSILDMFGNSGNQSTFTINLTMITDSQTSPNEDGSYEGSTNGTLTVNAQMSTGTETDSGSIVVSGTYGDGVEVLNVEGGDNSGESTETVKYRSSETVQNKSKPDEPFESSTLPALDMLWRDLWLRNTPNPPSWSCIRMGHVSECHLCSFSMREAGLSR